MELEETATDSVVDSVRVAVRVRPVNARERARAADSALDWRVDAHEIAQAVSGRPVAANTFAFDHVFGEGADNAEVFDKLARPVVRAALDGYNATIFAYGQTSSGKTHSMLGSLDDPGVTRRAIQEVFEAVRHTPDRQFLLRASYIEIYQEIIRDLLEPAHDNLKIHEDLNRRVYVEAREEVVSSVEQVMQMVTDGESVRAVGETNMNDRSSRSHTIFRLLIESRAARASDVGVDTVENDAAEPVDEGIAVRASTLSLVDLAGSERANLTGAEGVRLKEGSHINKSLLTLGNVINKLSSSEPGAIAHIPYRDSKLTRILQPALGGNARTAILCAITPAVMHMEETLSTLKFASRAKRVKNRTQCNEYLNDTAKLRKCEREVAQLKKLLAEVTSGDAGSQLRVAEASQDAQAAAENKRIHAFQEKFDALMRKMMGDTHAGMTQLEDPAPARRRRRPSSETFRYALDLCMPPKRRRLSCSGSNARETTFCERDGEDDSKELPADAEEQLAKMRKSVFAAEQARARMRTEIEFERKAMAAEVDTLAQVAEEANRSRYAAEEECQGAVSALAHSQSAAIVDEFIATAMVLSESQRMTKKAEDRVKELQIEERKAKSLAQKAAGLERELSEAKKREKRGIGPIQREVNILKEKLSDSDSKLKSAKQTCSKTLSEKATVEKNLLGKERQMRILETELQKYRKHEAMSNSRSGKELAAERQKAENQRAELNSQIERITAKLEQSLKTNEERLTEMQSLQMANEALTAKLQATEAEAEEHRLAAQASQSRAEIEASRSANLESQIESTKMSAESATKVASEELEKAHALVKERDEELQRARADFDELFAEHESLLTSAADDREHLQETQALLENTRTQIKNLTDVITRKENELKSTESDAASLRSEVTNLEGAMKAARTELARLTSELAVEREARDESANALSAASASSEEAQEIARKENACLKAALEQAQRVSADASSQLSTLSGIHAKTVEDLQNARTELNRLQSEMESRNSAVAESQKRIETLVAEIQYARTELTTLHSELEKRNTTIAESQKRSETLAAEVQHVQAELSLLQSKLEERNTTISESQNRIESLVIEKQGMADASRKQSSHMQSQLADMHRIHRFAGDELKLQKEEVRTARERMQAESNRLAQEVEKSSKRGVALLEKVYERDTRIGELERKLEEYRRSGGAIRRLEQKLQRRDATIAELRCVLEEQNRLITNGGLAEPWNVAERASRAEATVESLRAEVSHQENEIARLEAREAAGQEERRMLRREIKAREVAREKARSEKICSSLRAKENSPKSAN